MPKKAAGKAPSNKGGRAKKEKKGSCKMFVYHENKRVIYYHNTIKGTRKEQLENVVAECNLPRKKWKPEYKEVCFIVLFDDYMLTCTR